MKLLDDRVLVEILEVEEKIGSILKPQADSELKKTKGKILYLGQKCKYIHEEVKQGDIVIFKKYAGTRMDYEDKKCVLLRESELDVICYE
jgi:chaperonin GroES